MIRTSETVHCDGCKTQSSYAWYTETTARGALRHWCGHCAGVPEPTRADYDAGWRPPAVPPLLAERTHTTAPSRTPAHEHAQLTLDLPSTA